MKGQSVLDIVQMRDAMYKLEVSYKKTLNHLKVDLEKRSIFCQKIKELEEKDMPIVYIAKVDLQ